LEAVKMDEKGRLIDKCNDLIDYAIDHKSMFFGSATRGEVVDALNSLRYAIEDEEEEF